MDNKSLLALVFIFGGMTYLFPTVAAILAVFSRKQKNYKLPESLSLQIVVPCFNEADTILQTISSLHKSKQTFLGRYPNAKVQITIGLDGTTDATRQLLEPLVQSGTIRLQDRGSNRGKWITLMELIANTQGDWCALVDAGSIWPEDFLLQMAPDLFHGPFIGLAPGYRQQRAGLLERLIWWQERTAKFLENLAGGPFSLHGATMIFRTPQLQAAMREVSYKSWLNDDVVLGLVMRSKGAIKYYGNALCVADCGVRSGASEIKRRTRMLLGNVEWIREILPKVFKSTPLVGLLALRRIMRIFWAYNLILSFFLLCRLSGLSLLQSLLFGAAGFLVFATNRRLREAGWVSLYGPILIAKQKTTVSWS